MATISTCPHCQEQVTIPAGVDAAAEVRCPLCSAEYALGEALALAPPELIPVVPVAAERSDAAVDAVPLPPAEAREETTSRPIIEEENEAAAVAKLLPATSVSERLRTRPSKSAVRTVVEVVLGGVAGCLVAYYALALWFRSDFDKYLPELPLPFISRLTAPPPGDAHLKEKPRLAKPADH